MGVEREVVLPPVPTTPKQARTLVREVLLACGRPTWVDAAELAVTELTTNVVLHAHTDLTLRVHCGDGHLRVEVEDLSPTVPTPRHYVGTSSTGRGLAMVAAVAHEHGTRETPTGKVVWFSLSDDRPGEPLAPEALLELWDDGGWTSAAPRAEEPVRTVRLAGFPPTLWSAAMQMQDALLRELALYRVARGMAVEDLAAADRARFAIASALDRALAGEEAQRAARSPLPAGNPAWLSEVPPVVELDVAVDESAASGFAALQDVLDEANRLAAHGQLLASASLPEIVALRDWAAEQVISQLAGQAPMAWPGAEAEHFLQPTGPVARETDDDVEAVIGASSTAIVVDRQNRILGVSHQLAEQIGWAARDLVGRRVVAVVPPRYREAHVAGFTRHLSTGQAHALRVELTLPVLHADGREVPCRFWIDTVEDGNGQPVYVAQVTPIADSGA